MNRQVVKNTAAWQPIHTRLTTKNDKVKVTTSSLNNEPVSYPCLLLWTGYIVNDVYTIEYDFVYPGEI